MWRYFEKSRVVCLGLTTICLVLDLAIAHETAIDLVKFSTGDSRVRIPCLCFRDVQPESVKIVTWDVIKGDSLVPLDSVIVLEARHPENMSNPREATWKYSLGEGLSLLVESPELTDSARYRCEIVLKSNRTLSSTVQLKVHDDQQPTPDAGIRHYVIPAIVVVVLVIELGFVFALWVNLRDRRPDRQGLSYVDIFSPFQVSPKAWYTDAEEAPIPPWKVDRSREHRLLMEDLNDGSVFERDSGFDDKMSVTTTSREPEVEEVV
ncbi:uncharacterized protein LOC135464170 [Liolophura sinensis]|uniref:uncharacterized protein LOC135464170 n=1 Tax=Liolophura sinensis TaxID=3198878 RepID=UPI003157F321